MLSAENKKIPFERAFGPGMLMEKPEVMLVAR